MVDNPDYGKITDGIGVFFDIKSRTIIFWTGDREKYQVVYHDDMIYIKSFGHLIFMCTAPILNRECIEAYLDKVSINIEGTTPQDYDIKKKEMFELMRQSR